MYIFKTWDAYEYDLDDPKTYANLKEYKGTVIELSNNCLKHIGYVEIYVNYLRFPYSSPYDDQMLRIKALYHEFSNNYMKRWEEDNEENRLWFKKWLFRFLDEIENMC